MEKLLNGLAKPEKMAVKAVDAAAPLLQEELKRQIRSVADRQDKNGKPYSTGELAASIGLTKAKENTYGVFAVAKPEGVDSKGLRNVEKMAYLEHGVAAHGQLPRPVRQKTVNAVEEKCEKIMQDVIYKEVDQL